MRIGFTGTREGMSERQKEQLRELLIGVWVDSFHHGDCEGADDEADTIAMSMPFPPHIVVHPPINKTHWANTDQKPWPKTPGYHTRTTLPSKEYLDRDRDIVDQTDHLVAAPKSVEEERRSGTWYTIRYARSVGKPVTILER